MPYGKPAGIPCVQLMPDYRCALFGQPERPAVCARLRPVESMCGHNAAAALRILTELEIATAPAPFDEGRATNVATKPALRMRVSR